MKLMLVLVLSLTVTAVLARGNSKRKERTRNKRLDDRILNAREGGMDEGDDEYDEVEVHKQKESPKVELKNPCNKLKCKRGEICQLNGEEAICVCQTCEIEEESVVKVCSTRNVTYESECELDRDHCLCKNREVGCSNDGQDRVRLDYFAACKELTKCPDNELADFPARMRDWLFRIMRTVAQQADIEEYRDMLESARHDEYHAAAVVWKFCDLDADPEDKIVTRRELMYIIASVKPMEHCLVRFLNGCDKNDDHAITLEEWGTCLGLEHEAIKDQCKPIHARRG